MSIRFLVALVAVWLPCFAGGAFAAVEGRTALLIGNAHYAQKPLRNALNDVDDLAAALRQQGFHVLPVVKDATKRQMEEAVERFAAELGKRGGVGLFYYAGHGLQPKKGGGNYLQPVDAVLTTPADVPERAVAAGWVLEKMREASKTCIVILDACRDNPFPVVHRGGGRGLAAMQPPKGAYVLYAASPGEVAKDGAGRNGLFTRHLLRHLPTPGLPLEQLAKKVAADVSAESLNDQTPWAEGMILGDFSFRLAGGDPPPQPARPVSVPAPSTQSTSSTGSTSSKPKAGGSFTDPLAGEFVYVPGGEFMMGSNDGEADEKPPHKVRVSGFYLGKYEVTVGQYLACVADKGCPEPEGREAGSKYHYQRGSNNYYKKLGASLTGDRSPIVGVSWDNAQAFAAWLRKKSGKKYRLPSEAEWEYAARSGGRSEKWSGTSDESRLGDYAWYGENFEGTTHEVGRKLPNGLGLHDMSGNVWEWVQDCWHDNYASNPPVDGTAWETSCQGEYRVGRGGSWSGGAGSARAAYRDDIVPGSRSINLGFRLVAPQFGEPGK